MDEISRAYEFSFRGLLTEEALDAAGRPRRRNSEYDLAEVSSLLSIDALDEDFVAQARAMSIVYVAIAAFENSVRSLISSTLLEQVGEDWWQKCVSQKIRDQATQRMEEEAKVRWHAQRGSDPLNFTMLPNLLSIVRQNQDNFRAFIPDVEWAASIFDVIEKSRNVIMHSGTLGKRDIARLGTFIRDWIAQVGI